jgi:aminocarboxymuconate-semialdehyde decarboxylase
MKIDVHAHLMGREYYDAMDRFAGTRRAPHRNGLVILKGEEVVININEDWLDPSHCVREMDKRGIDLSILTLTTPNLYVFPKEVQAEAARISNDEGIERVRKYPDRLRLAASLPFDDVPAAVKEVDRVAGIKEVVGISVGSNVGGVPMSDPRFEPIWAAIDKHKMAVIEHPNFPTFAKDLPEYNLSLMMGLYFDTQICVTRMICNGVFARYPNMKFIVAHTGAGMLAIMNRLGSIPRNYPDAQEKMKGKSFEDYAKNLYYDTCSIGQNGLMLAHDYVGRERMMFGTDYPYTPHTTKYVEDLPLSPADKELCLGGNAQRVFGL